MLQPVLLCIQVCLSTGIVFTLLLHALVDGGTRTMVNTYEIQVICPLICFNPSPCKPVRVIMHEGGSCASSQRCSGTGTALPYS
ncbi:hypothetical protein BU23DRAFT_559215 [Bimuria novae-zelandiae CBS 107.79]|uniref:Uncharacterized protein n=1 Tax=Bimuria novae-zelandiae CBS 107.79 TaxID=1447943 RepID=A0A6A5UQU0_9PLEO|nr:hypothetical protein BU23DRAFT_559215 [Bimuria novae-zelandiae CBS 107.79]